MSRENGGFGKNSVSVPSFMKENPNNGKRYIERETTAYNGYNQTKERVPSPERKELSGKTEPNRKKQSRRKKKRNRIINRIFLITLMLLAVVAGNLVARIHAQVNSTLNTMDRSSGVDLSNVSINNTNVQADDRIINILLVGADKRESWKEAGRSDSVMIATLDLKHKRLKLTSLMRDMYVPIPGYYETKFNAAYSFGGVELLYQTVAENFNIKADGYVVVDFSAFKKVINALGGVDVELTQDEYEYLTTAYKKGSVLDLKPGMNTMNGAQALAYTRIRQDAQGDFGRTQRQRKVLQAIFKEAKSLSFSEDIDLAKTILGDVKTDLSNDEILSYLTSILLLGTTEIDQMRIPIDDSYTQDRINNQAVLVPDLAVNQQALQEFIYQYNGE